MLLFIDYGGDSYSPLVAHCNTYLHRILLYEACIIRTTYQSIVQGATTPSTTHLLCKSFFDTLVSRNALMTPWQPLGLRNRQLYYPHARHIFRQLYYLFYLLTKTGVWTTLLCMVSCSDWWCIQQNVDDDAQFSGPTGPAQIGLRKMRQNTLNFFLFSYFPILKYYPTHCGCVTDINI